MVHLQKDSLTDFVHYIMTIFYAVNSDAKLSKSEQQATQSVSAETFSDFRHAPDENHTPGPKSSYPTEIIIRKL